MWPSFAWPSDDEWSQARAAFSAVGVAFEEELLMAEAAAELSRSRTTQGAAVSLESGVAAQPEAEPLVVWERISRSGAPSAVRSNGWLMVAWAFWCVRAEEPGLVWLGAGGLVLVAVTQIYPAVRWLVALAMALTGA